MKRNDDLFDRQISTLSFKLYAGKKTKECHHKNHMVYVFVNAGKVQLTVDHKTYNLDPFNEPFSVGIFQKYQIEAIDDSEIFKVMRGKAIDGDEYYH